MMCQRRCNAGGIVFGVPAITQQGEWDAGGFQQRFCGAMFNA